jgi:hypothetical protein
VNGLPWGAVMVTRLWPWFRVCGRDAPPAQAGRDPLIGRGGAAGRAVLAAEAQGSCGPLRAGSRRS